MTTPLRRWKQSPALKKKQQRSLDRKKNLSHPFTYDDITGFMKCLVAVPTDGDECWLYVGCRQAATEGLRFKLGSYSNRKFHGETVGPHQFAYAASMGIRIADLAGYDVHHAAKFGRCVGYRCCNPLHLEKVKHREHAHVHADKATRKEMGDRVAERHVLQIESILLISPADRGPVERKPIRHGGRLHRVFAGLPFLIRLGQMDGIEQESDVTEAVTKSVTTCVETASTLIEGV